MKTERLSGITVEYASDILMDSGSPRRTSDTGTFDFAQGRRGRPYPHSLCQMLFSCVADAPDGAGSVIAHQQRSVFSNCEPNWPSPDLPVISYKSGHKV